MGIQSDLSLKIPRTPISQIVQMGVKPRFSLKTPLASEMPYQSRLGFPMKKRGWPKYEKWVFRDSHRFRLVRVPGSGGGL
jgi:hypothetical protein